MLGDEDHGLGEMVGVAGPVVMMGMLGVAEMEMMEKVGDVGMGVVIEVGLVMGMEG